MANTREHKAGRDRCGRGGSKEGVAGGNGARQPNGTKSAKGRGVGFMTRAGNV